MPDADKLTPAEPRDLADALAFARSIVLQYSKFVIRNLWSWRRVANGVRSTPPKEGRPRDL